MTTSRPAAPDFAIVPLTPERLDDLATLAMFERAAFTVAARRTFNRRLPDRPIVRLEL